VKRDTEPPNDCTGKHKRKQALSCVYEAKTHTDDKFVSTLSKNYQQLRIFQLHIRTFGVINPITNFLVLCFSVPFVHYSYKHPTPPKHRSSKKCKRQIKVNASHAMKAYGGREYFHSFYSVCTARPIRLTPRAGAPIRSEQGSTVVPDALEARKSLICPI
jgi:flagellar biosynthesis component FlhA